MTTDDVRQSRKRKANREYMARQRALDPEKFRERARCHYARNPEPAKEYQRRYRDEYRDEINAKARQARAETPDKFRARDRTYREAHPMTPEARVKYAEPYRAKAIENARAHRARAHGVGGDHFTSAEFVALCDEFGNICLCCGSSNVRLTADHVIPLSKGGSDGITNIQPLCLTCNSRKGNAQTDFRRPTDSVERMEA